MQVRKEALHRLGSGMTSLRKVRPAYSPERLGRRLHLHPNHTLSSNLQPLGIPLQFLDCEYSRAIRHQGLALRYRLRVVGF